MENFITIKNNRSELVVKKSKFICNAVYVESKEEAENKLKEFKKEFHDARHNCYAYRVLEGEQIIERSSDDGEPSGTAGAPMLNILQKNNLCNILVVVTRYFGGILLGTGGLVSAYSDVTLNTINGAEKIEKCTGVEFEVTLDYSEFENFKYYCKKNHIYIGECKYEDKIICKIELKEEDKQKLIDDFETKKVNLSELKYFRKKIINNV